MHCGSINVFVMVLFYLFSVEVPWQKMLWKDKGLLRYESVASSGILSKTIFSKNYEVDVKCLGCSVHKEVKRDKGVLLFSRARLVAQSTVREFMPWKGWGEWGRKDAVLMTSWWCFSSILSALFGSQGLFHAHEYKHLMKRKKEKKVSHQQVCLIRGS